jgi:H+/Cl- antiporter ClcA
MGVVATPQPNEARGEDQASASPLLWLLVCATGAAAGLAGVALFKLLDLTQAVAWSCHGGTMLEAVTRAPWWRRVAVVTLAGLIAGIGQRLMQHKTAGHGGGLNETIWFHGGAVPFLRTLARALLSIVVVGMGESLGREGAFKQTGAAFASLLARGRQLSPGQMRLLSACGAAGGMAAAYNVPLGGALFGMEVLLGSFSVALAVPLLVASLIATGIVRLVLSPAPVYVVPMFTPTLAHIAFALVVGPLFGLVAALYVRWIGFVDAHRPQGPRQLYEPIVVSFALGLVAIVLPQLLGNGRDLVQAALVGSISVALAQILTLLKPAATGMCLGAGIPGGLFTPTLCVGALAGGVLGAGAHALWPDAPQASFALLGMAALLAGATHGPISALVMVAELTANGRLALPLMLACSSAVVVARRIDVRSIYSVRLHRRMEESTVPSARPRLAGGRWLERPVVSSATRLSILAATRLSMLAATRTYTATTGEAIVVDENGVPLGQIAPSRVASALATNTPLSNIVAADVVEPLAEVNVNAAPEALARHAPDTPLAVVAPGSRRLIGVLAPNAPESSR